MSDSQFQINGGKGKFITLMVKCTEDGVFVSFLEIRLEENLKI